ncbi:YdcH family protein [Profundibacter sp.]|uniref:YdcH family protein n=1 Tax=Profundibacter sp. TaxID=3101071 RepID=UPI003D0E535D
MSHTPNELPEEFPDRVDQMSNLKQSDAHFAKLFDDYHEINRAVHRAETDVEPTDDLHMAEMRKQRLSLKDEIWAILLAQDKA